MDNMGLFDGFDELSNDSKEEFRKFMDGLKDKVIGDVITKIGTEYEYDDGVVLALFLLICNTPLIFDLMKIVIRNAYCGDSTQIEKLMDELQMKSIKTVEEKGLLW